MIKAVIIDYDDTLVLTEAACYNLENEVLSNMGREPMSRQAHLETWGEPLYEAIFKRSPGINLRDFQQAYAPVVAEYIRTGKLDDIPPATYDTLQQLWKDGREVIILTGRTLSELHHVLDPGHDLTKYVKRAYYYETTKFHKPDPRVFDEALADFNLQPADAVYVGDSVYDAVAAKGAGLHFICSLESGLRRPEDFAQVPVDAFINTFSEVVAAVSKL